MRALLLGLIFAGSGCAVAPSEESAETTAAAQSTSSMWCLYPSTHPFNGVSQVFTLDRTPAGEGDALVVTRSTGFYWHDVLITLSEATESWPIDSTDETDGTHVAGRGASSKITVDLTAPVGEFDARVGKVQIRPMFGGDDDEVVPIRRVDAQCPVRTHADG